MPTPTPALVPKTYAELKRGVEQTLLAGQRRVERAKVLTYFETGRLINEHVRVNGDRADYGERVLDRLARDLAIARTTLYQCTQFARYFPIVRHGGQLNWAHYRLLCQVDDETARNGLLAQTLKNDWTSPELQERVRTFNAAPAEAEAGSNGEGANAKPKLLAAKHGTPGLYPVVERKTGLALDLGFKMFLPFYLIPGGPPRGARAGDIVRVTEENTLVRDSDVTRADLFTYRCSDLRVVDGDTLAVTIASPPHNDIDKKLRLRGLNCPEMDTAAGKAAKRFAQQLVDTATSVVLTTTKPDKYDRYLADVFVTTPAGEEIYLNNALLENGHADRMEAGAPPPELL